MNKKIIQEIKTQIQASQIKASISVNKKLLKLYWSIAQLIVERQKLSSWGDGFIKSISKDLQKEFPNIKGFSIRNIKYMRQWYFYWNSIGQTVSAQFKLSWSHYIFLCKIDKLEERNFYEIESTNNNWSLRELKRQFDTGLYERLVLSRDKEEIKLLSKQRQIIEKPKDLVKDPYVLEFLGLEGLTKYSENDLETAIINHIEKFIMELGKGFLFQGRQVKFTFDEEHFFVDLVFYNRILKCFVVIDLKIGKLKHQDIGQMQMYVNYYDRYVKLDDENKTIGIIICKNKNDTLVEITLPENNTQIFASRYKTILPSKEELKKIVEDEN